MTVYALLCWESSEKKVYAHYFFPFNQMDVSINDINRSGIYEGMKKFCKKNQLILWNY